MPVNLKKRWSFPHCILYFSFFIFLFCFFKQVRIPEWFTERTSFCFKSFTTNNEGQCNGRADNHKCAHPNRMTALYWDKTYLSDAGCRMSWKIAGSAHPTWFNAVKARIYFRNLVMI